MKLYLQACWHMPDADVHLNRTVDIPFLPHVGMCIGLDGWGYRLATIAWKEGTGELSGRLDDVTSSETWEKAKEDLLRQPYWAVAGVYPKSAAK